jgi:8-oxo-dGTP pyrophosphatase MutT (NUDIX family)
VTAPADPGTRLAPDDDLPEWLRPLVGAIDGAVLPERFTPLRGATAPADARHSAVLMLFGHGVRGPDVLLTARASTLRSHAGQPAFPGGRAEPGEHPVETALREAEEETGLDPSSVLPAAWLPELYLAHSLSLVRPVLGFWHTPGPVSAVDPAETAAVARVPIADLVDPANRGRVRLSNGYAGAAFTVAGMVVWGFTAALLDLLLDLGGWSVPWDGRRLVRLPAESGIPQ